jgi:hypothetical protein
MVKISLRLFFFFKFSGNDPGINLMQNENGKTLSDHDPHNVWKRDCAGTTY